MLFQRQISSLLNLGKHKKTTPSVQQSESFVLKVGQATDNLIHPSSPIGITGMSSASLGKIDFYFVASELLFLHLCGKTLWKGYIQDTKESRNADAWLLSQCGGLELA